jgi:hypothetical protein
MLSEEFKESKITDLVYRFLLWFFIACLILLCKSIFNGLEYADIEKIITYLPEAANRISLLLVFSVLSGTTAIAFIDLGSFINKNQKIIQSANLNCILKELPSLFKKITSDFILIAYAIFSFLVGSVVFICVYLYDEFSGDGDSVIKILFILFAFSFFIVALGAWSITIRSTNEDPFYSKFLARPFSKRLISYSLVIIVGLLVIRNVVTT